MSERAAVEDFLYHEADLLDRWALHEWADLFTDDGEYLVPSTDTPDGDPVTSLYLIFDDRARITERAIRLLSRHAHAEFPHSSLRHMVSNVRILSAGAEELEVGCNLVAYRSSRDRVDIFPAHCEYLLRRGGAAGFQIRSKKAILDTQSLRTQNRLSFII